MSSKRKKIITLLGMSLVAVVILGVNQLFVSADSDINIKSIGLIVFLGVWLLIMAIIWFTWTT